MKVKPFLLFSLTLFICCSNASDEVIYRQGIEEAVTRQLTTYPKSTLIDIYKSFFQDKFGPGHMLSDTAKAAAFLRQELNSFHDASGPEAEVTGYEGNFVRVNLSLVKTGKIPLNRFFQAFVKSSENAKKVSLPEWKNEWIRIEDIITTMNVDIPNYEGDKEYLEGLLMGGEYVVSHSKQYTNAYSPHYRLISYEIWKQLKKEFSIN